MPGKRRKKMRRGRRNRTVNSAMTALVQRGLRQNPKTQWVEGADANGVKMSEVIEDFLEPYRDLAKTMREYRTLLNMGLIAWNLSLFSEQEQSPELDRLIAKLPKGEKEMGKNIIRELTVRKKQHFSEYRRMVVDFELTDTKSGWHLSVASTFEDVAVANRQRGSRGKDNTGNQSETREETGD